MIFSENQLQALNEKKNLVLTASPGSGKTTIISEKIRKLISEKKTYSGVIAVSYTNKASYHLRDKVKKDGISVKNCYFGTIDKFCISEIIMPFANKIAKAKNELTVLKYHELIHKNIPGIELHPNAPIEIHNNIHTILAFLNEGYILLDFVAETALIILEKSVACKKYISSKYTHFIVDEYQDCGEGQHLLFMKIKELCLTCIVAGDPHQSIFIFAKKYPRYLLELTTNSDFKHIEIEENFRSHSSIVLFSKNFKSPQNLNSFDKNKSRIVYKITSGDEQSVYNFINEELRSNRLNTPNNTIAVFYKSKKSCEEGCAAIENTKLSYSTPIDEYRSIPCAAFREIFFSSCDPHMNSYEFASRFLNEDFDKNRFNAARKLFQKLTKSIEVLNLTSIFDEVKKLAKIITATTIDEKSEQALTATIADQNFKSNYSPIEKGTVNIMTYHKAKGLEFDIVFMPEMYEYIIPYEHADAIEEQEDNVFFVGLTRSKKLLFLCHSTLRHSSTTGNVYRPNASKYYSRNDGDKLLLEHAKYVTINPLNSGN